TRTARRPELHSRRHQRLSAGAGNVRGRDRDGSKLRTLRCRNKSDILRRLAHGIRKRGRVILDLWNPEFFKAHQGERELMVSKGVVRENKRVIDDRLVVWLHYPETAHEQFEWQLFTPEQMEQLATSVGLGLLVSGTDFDLASLPSPANPRIQFLMDQSK